MFDRCYQSSLIRGRRATELRLYLNSYPPSGPLLSNLPGRLLVADFHSSSFPLEVGWPNLFVFF